MLPFLGYSQSSDDVIRIMNEDVAGTARTMGLGGAQSVLGADIGSFQYNPASIGLFRSSQITFSGTAILDKNKSIFQGEETSSNQQNATINNFGIAFATTDDSKSKFKNITIGFSYHRKVNFENDYAYEGLNNNNSLTTYLGEQTTLLTSENPNVLNTRGIIETINNIPELAWKSELIKDPINDSLFYGSAHDGGVYQKHIFADTLFL